MAPDDPNGRQPGPAPGGASAPPDPFAPEGFGAGQPEDPPLALDTSRVPPPPAVPATPPPTGVGPSAYTAYGAAPPPGAPPPNPYAPSPYAAASPSGQPGEPYVGPPPGGPPPAGTPYGGLPLTGGQAMCAVHAQTPAVGLCPRCGAYMCAWCQRINEFGEIFCVTCMERVGYGAPVPWDRRAELGTWPALWQTFKESLMKPDEFFARATHGLTTDAPLLYAMICGWLGQLGYSVVRLAMKEQVSVIALSFVAVPISVLLSIYLGGGIAHLFARMFGGQGSYQATARNWGFCHGPGALGLIPLLGAMVAGIWTIVLEVYAVKHAHRLSGGKAAAAVLLPLGIILVLCCGAIFALGAAIGGLAAGRGGGFGF